MADLLLAVRLIEVDRHHHRHKDRFQFRSHAAKAALRCAALSTRLPDVDADAFLIGLSAPVSHLAHSLSAENSGRRRRLLSIQDVTKLTRLMQKPLDLKNLNNPMDLAAMRCHKFEMKVQPTLTLSLRGIFLDRIHGVYLRAISRIPMEDFRGRYHHGLLKAGYCYGPLNPMFPAPDQALKFLYVSSLNLWMVSSMCWLPVFLASLNMMPWFICSKVI